MINRVHSNSKMIKLKKTKIMKTFLKTLDGPETEPQQIRGHEFHEFIDNNASKKASSYLRVKLTFLVTLAITLAAFLMTACEDDSKICTGCPNPHPAPPVVNDPLVIRSMYPSAGAPGTAVTIIVENFNNSAADHYVTFGSSFAEIIYSGYGMLTVNVPMDLQDGDYPVNIRSNGQIADAPLKFKVIKGTN
jgi:hypothetical protein